MYAVLKSFWDIIRLQKGPEDLPASPLLLTFSLLLWVFTFALAYAVFDWLDGRRLVIAAAASLLAIGSPSTETITSPAWMPAVSAGLVGRPALSTSFATLK